MKQATWPLSVQFNFIPPNFNELNLEPDDEDIFMQLINYFWTSVAGDDRISDEFKDYLDQSNLVAPSE